MHTLLNFILVCILALVEQISPNNIISSIPHIYRFQIRLNLICALSDLGWNHPLRNSNSLNINSGGALQNLLA
jgi:hypothetical protein